MTVLVDTSAWIEYLRGTGSPVLARDRDFEALAQVSDLVIEPPQP